MPRSGSELLQVILHQNPEIYGSATSPILEYWYGARQNTEMPEVMSQPEDLMKSAFLGFCKGGMDGYYNTVTTRPIVCDKSRGWMYYQPWLKDVLGKTPKMICMVRDLREVVSSMEKVWRKTRHLPTGVDNPANMQGITVDQRVGHWLTSQPIGLALQRLYDADVQGYLDDIHIVRYEDLTSDPVWTMNEVYEYLELPVFEHDFNNVNKEVIENSRLFGPYGNHDVKPKVEPQAKKYNELLGRDVSESIVQSNLWYFNKFYS